MVHDQGVFGEVAAQYGRQSGEASLRPRCLGRQSQDGAAVDLQAEGCRLMGHGLALHLVGDGLGLGALGLHELEPGGGGVEQVPDLDPGAMRTGEGGGGGPSDRPALHHQAPGLRGALGAGGQGQPGHRADRRQGLAPEAQGGNVQEVIVAGFVRGELGGGVPLHRQEQLVGGQARPVVLHQYA